ncbi:hypothetical protein COE51_21350 [Bacillus pseudomycoides]|nr:hypothetical protein COE51_21350 [Bacillus pseudomycoides]
MGIKMIYKKTLAMDLIKLGHDLEYTSKNRENQKYQVFFFQDCPQLRKDMCMLLGQEYIEEKRVD